MKRLAPLVFAMGVLAGCGATSDDGGAGKSGRESSFVRTLPDTEYLINATNTGRALLQDGIYTEPAAPGSATKIMVELGDLRAFGDIDDDGVVDAAVLLVGALGGSGTFTYLAVVINDEGTAVPLESVLLGDRIIVDDLAIESGKVTVHLRTRRSDEAMAAEPTVKTTRSFALRDHDLVPVP